ncbi:MAG: DOMON-like domain-containing protein [Rhizomicrobium sp.]|jgi:hypothetical protein
MRHALKLNPDSRCDAAKTLEVDVARSRGGNLVLRYVVTGDIGALRLPPTVPSARADELWHSTCFEAFVRPSPDAAYYEFNFSPSTQWAAYGFTSHRTGMRVAGEIRVPHLKVRSDAARVELEVSLELDGLPKAVLDSPWRLGLSAVIEETSGRKSYWALAHPPGRPDFHHADCFALEVPTA